MCVSSFVADIASDLNRFFHLRVCIRVHVRVYVCMRERKCALVFERKHVCVCN